MKDIRDYSGPLIQRPAVVSDLAVVSDGDGMFVAVVTQGSVGGDVVAAWGDCEQLFPRGTALIIPRESLRREDGLSLIGRRFDSFEAAGAVIWPMFARAKGGAPC